MVVFVERKNEKATTRLEKDAKNATKMANGGF